MLRTEIEQRLKLAGIHPSRDLGQNFLLNDQIASLIAAEAPSSRSVLEIGSGLGALTEKLIPVCRELTGIEISSRMSAFLKATYPAEDIRIVTADFLTIELQDIPGYPFDTIVGNLPYSISSPILFRFLEGSFSCAEKIVVMLQREVAIRLSSLDGGKEYGKLSLQLWPYFTVKTLLDAVPDDFYPAPDVHSRVVVLHKRKEPLISKELFPYFRKVVKASFAMRRKTILNNLTNLCGRDAARDVLEELGIDDMKRAEQLKPREFIRLAKELR